ncbi:ABATE domain-containing protein [Microbacterium tenebrionis]|uniref:ABATE domain-containing protein n=1 Tax=Microbacterium tenebrionis TaxID=2830665 RepID=UPI001D0D6FD9|nr:ABATE domain-containing protein [Microbacterium tenebrionis]
MRPPAADGGEVDEDTVNDGAVARFHALRDAIRTAAAQVASAGRLDAVHAETLNDFSRRVPAAPQLVQNDAGEWVRRMHATGPSTDIALAAIASDATELFSGVRAAQLRACTGPNCPLFFLQDRPRRHWCSPGCGTRARAAAAYSRRTAGRRPTPAAG